MLCPNCKTFLFSRFRAPRRQGAYTLGELKAMNNKSGMPSKKHFNLAKNIILVSILRQSMIEMEVQKARKLVKELDG